MDYLVGFIALAAIWLVLGIITARSVLCNCELRIIDKSDSLLAGIFAFFMIVAWPLVLVATGLTKLGDWAMATGQKTEDAAEKKEGE